ncbi:ubiquitin-conjugating enzyme/RWD-like protein [Kalaharituber pfeilii]|nr:ubiquitin-conjugating enzyme/RWD-like protein [Kalaharituber pfeilii]
MAASNRIPKELADLTKDPPPYTVISLPSDSDIYNWNIVLAPPKESVYHGGEFHLSLKLPTEYPFKPPALSFITKIYHPNVTNDGKGSMCLGILRPENWKPSCKIRAVLLMAMDLLITPNVDDPVEPSIANEYTSSRDDFVRTAKLWVKNYAKPQSKK